MAELSINSNHKECDQHFEDIYEECQRKALKIAQETILSLNFSIERLRDLTVKTGDHLPDKLRGEFISVLLMARMQLDESWAAIREIWDHPAGPESHSSSYASRNLYTPPRSRPQSSRQVASNEAVADEGMLWPRIPLSEIFELDSQPYKGIQQTVRTTATTPFTPQHSPMPSFTEQTPPGPTTLHKSKSRLFDKAKTPSHYSEDSFANEYQTMAPSTEKEVLVSESQTSDFAVTCQTNLPLTHNDTPFPRRRKRFPKPAPPPTGPFLTPAKIQYRKPLPDPLSRVIKSVNRDLLRCCTLLTMSNPECLKFAENALALSEEAGIYHSVAKCQLYRGLCLMKLERWKEASYAFTRAAGVKDWMRNAWEMKNLAESNLLQESRRRGKTRLGMVREEVWDDTFG
jgi:hypothetical protein